MSARVRVVSAALVLTVSCGPSGTNSRDTAVAGQWVLDARASMRSVDESEAAGASAADVSYARRSVDWLARNLFVLEIDTSLTCRALAGADRSVRRVFHLEELGRGTYRVIDPKDDWERDDRYAIVDGQLQVVTTRGGHRFVFVFLGLHRWPVGRALRDG